MISSNNMASKWDNHEEFYEVAFKSEYSKIWHGVKLSSKDIRNLCYYRALASFLNSEPEDIIDRRKLLYAYASSEFSTKESDDTLNRYRNQLPTRNAVKRALENLCIAYDEVPKRIFSEDKKVNELMTGYYKEMEMASAMQSIYKAARLMQLVAVRPTVLDGKWRIDFMTPDRFRILADPTDSRRVASIIYPETNERGEVTYTQWSMLARTELNYKGQITKVEPNPFGAIPWVFLRLSKSKGLYSGGMWDLLESQIDVNKYRWQANVSATFAGSPSWLATNTKHSDLRMGPDKVITVEGVDSSEGKPDAPHVESIAADASYDTLEVFSMDRERTMQHAEGIPPSMTSNEGGQPASGVARLIERQEIIQTRKADVLWLQKYEQEFAEMVAIVAKQNRYGVDLVGKIQLNVLFADDKMYIEVETEYKLDKEKMADGAMSKEDFYMKWGGIEPDQLEQILAERLGPKEDVNKGKPEPVIDEQQ